MKRFDKPVALVLIGALLLTACNRGQETGTDVSSESAAGSSTDISETSNSGSFNGASAGAHTAAGLTEFGKGYEGIEGTGKYNYGEALQKEAVRSLRRPDATGAAIPVLPTAPITTSILPEDGTTPVIM